jgi:hypothetical protein
MVSFTAYTARNSVTVAACGLLLKVKPIFVTNGALTMKTIKHNSKALSQSDSVQTWQYSQQIKQAKKAAKQHRQARQNKHNLWEI